MPYQRDRQPASSKPLDRLFATQTARFGPATYQLTKRYQGVRIVESATLTKPSVALI